MQIKLFNASIFIQPYKYWGNGGKITKKWKRNFGLQRTTKRGISPVVIIALTEVFEGTDPSNFLFPFPWNFYLKTDGTSLLILFLVKNFEKKEI